MVGSSFKQFWNVQGTVVAVPEGHGQLTGTQTPAAMVAKLPEAKGQVTPSWRWPRRFEPETLATSSRAVWIKERERERKRKNEKGVRNEPKQYKCPMLEHVCAADCSLCCVRAKLNGAGRALCRAIEQASLWLNHAHQREAKALHKCCAACSPARRTLRAMVLGGGCSCLEEAGSALKCLRARVVIKH